MIWESNETVLDESFLIHSAFRIHNTSQCDSNELISQSPELERREQRKLQKIEISSIRFYW